MLLSLSIAAHAEEPCSDAAQVAADAAAVHTLYEASEAARDQRAKGDRAVLSADEKRAEEVWGLDAAGRLCAVQAKWEAAWLLTQSDKLDRLERAYALATETMKARDPRGPWLTAFTFDVMRTAQGYRQRFATQRSVNPQGKVCIVRNDLDVTDEERAKYGMPPYADTWREILDASGYTGDAATPERLDFHNLICEPTKAEKTGGGASAASNQLSGSEFRNTAETLPPGDFTFHPFLRSTLGVLPRTDVKLSPLGLLTGPQLWLEVQPIDSAAFDVSLEPYARSYWNFQTWNVGGWLHTTTHVGGNRINVSAAFERFRSYSILTVGTEDPIELVSEGYSVPINLGFDLQYRDDAVVRFTAETEVLRLVDAGEANVIVTVNYNHSVGRTFRFALGAGALVGYEPEFYRTADEVVDLPDIPVVLPFPTVEVWWRY